MRPANMMALTVACALTAACQRDRSEQNIAIDNNAAVADIEALPPDESSTTSTEELENGAANAITDANAGDNTTNSF